MSTANGQLECGCDNDECVFHQAGAALYHAIKRLRPLLDRRWEQNPGYEAANKEWNASIDAIDAIVNDVRRCLKEEAEPTV